MIGVKFGDDYRDGWYWDEQHGTWIKNIEPEENKESEITK